MKAEITVKQYSDLQPAEVMTFDAEPIKESVIYVLTTDHAASSYGFPVLVGPDGTAFGPEDHIPGTSSPAWMWVDWASVTPEAEPMQARFVNARAS